MEGYHAKMGGRGESEEAMRLKDEHWSIVVGPDTESDGSCCGLSVEF